MLGLTGKRGDVLDAMLTTSRSSEPVRPARIAADEGRWRSPARVELFVDFETVTDINESFSKMPDRGGQGLIFQVGCGRVVGGEWHFRQFTVFALTLEAEGKMLDEWCAFVSSVAGDEGVPLADVRLVHWSPAETSSFETAYNSARARHPERSWPSFNWYDLFARVFAAEPVTVRGAFGFGLKDVAAAMKRQGLISHTWDGSGPGDGLAAMAGALALGDRPLMEDAAFLRDVSIYNEIDCRVMSEVLSYIRKHH